MPLTNCPHTKIVWVLMRSIKKGPYGAIAQGAVISTMYDVRIYFLFLIQEAWFGKTDAEKATAHGKLEDLESHALVPSSQDFGFTHTKPCSKCNRRDQLQHFLSLYHPTFESLFLVKHRPISYDIHHTPLSHPHLSMDSPTTPPLLFTTPFRFLTPTQPLSIPLQHLPNKPTIHHIPTPHSHTSTHTTTHRPWFLLLTLLLVNFVFLIHSIKFNFQRTTPPFQYLYKTFHATFVLTTPPEPDHNTLVILNRSTSWSDTLLLHPLFNFSHLFNHPSNYLLAHHTRTTPPHLLNLHLTHHPRPTAWK